MFKNNDKITLKTSDDYYLALTNETQLHLSEDQDEAIVWTVNFNENNTLGFKFQLEIDSVVYFINNDALNGYIYLVTDSSLSGTNWSCAPTLNNSGLENTVLFVALTQNGQSRFMNGTGFNSVLNAVAFPSLTETITSNSSVWSYSIK